MLTLVKTHASFQQIKLLGFNTGLWQITNTYTNNAI